MISICRRTLPLAVLLAGMVLWNVSFARAEEPGYEQLRRAERFVERSDRYMHHSKLKRGMKGYGLSVFAGTKIERFDVEILSVIRNFQPGRDAILVMLSGQNLAKTRVIQGMSGSPVFMRDPADGREKIVGAVAFGWGRSVEPICGLQPISYMLAMPGVLPRPKYPKTVSTLNIPAGHVAVSLPVLAPDSPVPLRAGDRIAVVGYMPPEPGRPPREIVVEDLVLLGIQQAEQPDRIEITVTLSRDRAEKLSDDLLNADKLTMILTDGEELPPRRIREALERLTSPDPEEDQTPSGAETRSRESDVSMRGDPRQVKEFLELVLASDPERFLRRAFVEGEAGPAGNLQPLGLPVAMSGMSEASLRELGPYFSGANLVPTQGGSTGGADTPGSDGVRLEAGSSVSIPLAVGDVNWSAIGTVTDVLGENVLALGHAMEAQGALNLPMSTGYVHAVVANQENSFKLASTLRPVGALFQDETVGVAGQIGPAVEMIPMRVRVRQEADSRVRTCDYEIVDDWVYTPLLGFALVRSSMDALRIPPRFHHTRYTVKVDFGEFGAMETSGVTGGQSGLRVGAEVARPILAMVQNPFGTPPTVRKIDVDVEIIEGDIAAEIIDLKLPRTLYRPGETVAGEIVVRRFRDRRERVAFEIELPENLPEGEYPLTVGDMAMAQAKRQEERPQMFEPRSVEQLFETLKYVARLRADRLYVHLPLPEGGVAIGREALADLPPSKAVVLLETRSPEMRIFRRSILESSETPYILQGSRQAKIRVRKQLNETRLD